MFVYKSHQSSLKLSIGRFLFRCRRFCCTKIYWQKVQKIFVYWIA